jgi:pimeloyl-ACP methyl ester carboxylesterase
VNCGAAGTLAQWRGYRGYVGEWPVVDARMHAAHVAKNRWPTRIGCRHASRLIEARDLAAAVALNVDTFVGPAADEATRELIAQMQRHAFEVQLNAKDVDAADVDYDIATITARTLVVAGAHDVDFFRETADHLAATIPGARLITLDRAGHLPSLEDPARLNPILLDFLSPPS